jgi:hypothetical protein
MAKYVNSTSVYVYMHGIHRLEFGLTRGLAFTRAVASAKYRARNSVRLRRPELRQPSEIDMQILGYSLNHRHVAAMTTLRQGERDEGNPSEVGTWHLLVFNGAHCRALCVCVSCEIGSCECTLNCKHIHG